MVQAHKCTVMNSSIFQQTVPLITWTVLVTGTLFIGIIAMFPCVVVSYNIDNIVYYKSGTKQRQLIAKIQ